MTIDRLGPVDPVAKYNKTNKSAKVSRQAPKDSVAVSEEARKQAALQQIAEAVRSTPEFWNLLLTVLWMCLDCSCLLT